MNTTPIIALLTDFGYADAYVGSMKGVMLSICPAAHLVDLTHAIEPQNVRQAAYVLMTAVRHFPAHTVFLVVVDPGVGTARQPIAVAADQGTFVAPDSGVLSYALARVRMSRAVVLENPDYRLTDVSTTFHGRDVFGPAAAHLANGVPVERLGPALPAILTFDEPRLDLGPTQIRGEVLHIDHFGNIITSIGHLAWIGPAALRLTPQFGPGRSSTLTLDATTCSTQIGTTTVHAVRSTYGAVPPGSLTALVGSSGQLEIGLNQGNAARTLDASAGDPVNLLFEP